MLAVGVYACVKIWPIIKNRLKLFKSGWDIGYRLGSDQIKELKNYINCAKGNNPSKKDEEELLPNVNNE